MSRKNTPLYSGCIAYFPDALEAIARLSKFGNDKHNPGEPLHWSRDKSNDHADCVARHLKDHGKIDEESGFSHTVALAWRALALLQTEIETVQEGTGMDLPELEVEEIPLLEGHVGSYEGPQVCDPETRSFPLRRTIRSLMPGQGTHECARSARRDGWRPIRSLAEDKRLFFYDHTEGDTWEFAGKETFP